MKLVEIAERLRSEFPDHTVFFKAEAVYYGSMADEASRLRTGLTVSCEALQYKQIKGDSLDDCIEQLHRLLRGFAGASDVDIDVTDTATT